jgi:lipoprotein-anchoring transpeptidase ErfK/SrfK
MCWSCDVPLGARRLALGLGATALAVSACAPAASLQFDTVEPSTESRATIAAQPSGAKKIDPAQRIVVTASDGQLAEVSVMGPKGPVKGDLSADGTVWTAKRPTLAFGSTYTVEATAIDPRGVATNHTDEFRTLEPKDFFSGRVAPGEGAIVGVGMPITVTFDREIKNKDEVERALVVYTPTPLEGAWSWNGPDTVEFRPKDYWPGNIDVTVDLNLKGVQGSKGVYGQGNRSTTFSIGPSMITKVDAQTHQAKVFRDGEKVRTIPDHDRQGGLRDPLGGQGDRQQGAHPGHGRGDRWHGGERSGVLPHRGRVRDARDVHGGVRARGAVVRRGSQGYANVSHGCIGMSTSNAQWLYDQTNVGDVVEVTGTSNPQNLGNGITVWNETWDEWLAGSKNGTVTTVAAGSPIPDPGTVTIPDGTTTAGDSATATQTSFRR